MIRNAGSPSEGNGQADDENMHELAEELLLAVRGGQFPSFDYIRQALDIAESLSDSVRPNDLA